MERTKTQSSLHTESSQGVIKNSRPYKDVKSGSKNRPQRKVEINVPYVANHNRGDNAIIHSAKSDGLPVLDRTFKLTPNTFFPETKVQSIIRDVLKKHLLNVDYHSDKCSALSKLISDEIKQRVKGLNLDRFKIIALVYLGADTSQSLNIGSRCVWNTQFDNFASSTFQGNSLFAVAAVYAIYFE